jgi:hypothetical protein
VAQVCESGHVRPRKTKLGDCSFDPKQRRAKITINVDTNPYRFLVTLVHEIAHAKVRSEYGPNIDNHGKEWKMALRDMIFLVKDLGVFPYDLEVAIERHFRNPNYTDTIDPIFTNIINQYGESKKTS